MKKILSVLCLLACLNVANARGSEWMPYVPYAPVISPPVVHYAPYPVAATVAVPVIVNQPVIVPYVPVLTYQNVVVEQRPFCFFRRYSVVGVPQTVYVPARY